MVGRLARPAASAGNPGRVPSARDAGVTGYVPSLEAYSFVATVAEEGQAWLKGKRQCPWASAGSPPGDPPYDELADASATASPTGSSATTRPAVRAVQGDPGAGGLRRGTSTPQAVDDLLTLQAVFATERTWCQPSPVVSRSGCGR